MAPPDEKPPRSLGTPRPPIPSPREEQDRLERERWAREDQEARARIEEKKPSAGFGDAESPLWDFSAIMTILAGVTAGGIILFLVVYFFLF